ncbi:MAG: hypothetical protein J0L75_20065 [Spirochaetes bacterium]|nr:hypothetical protein [Spirochaetota bacterium]
MRKPILFLLLLTAIAPAAWKGSKPFSGSPYSRGVYAIPAIAALESKAAALLAKADETEATGDLVKMRAELVAIIGEYPSTPSAAKAALKVGTFEALLANFDEALPFLVWAVNLHYWSESGPTAALTLAQSFYESGDLELAQDVIERLKKDAKSKRIPAEWGTAAQAKLDSFVPIAKK